MQDDDGAFKKHVDYAVGQYPWAVTTADFNGDGIADLAVSSLTNTIYILLGKK